MIPVATILASQMQHVAERHRRAGEGACAPPSFPLALAFGQAAIVIEDEQADCR